MATEMAKYCNPDILTEFEASEKTFSKSKISAQLNIKMCAKVIFIIFLIFKYNFGICLNSKV